MSAPPVSSVIQAIFYNNPDEYPPIINSTCSLTRAGYHVSVLCRENGQRWPVAYPSEARLQRVDTRSRSSWWEYLGFVARVLKQADRRALVFIGHDMHGLLPARLLAWRYRRPLPKRRMSGWWRSISISIAPNRFWMK